MQRYPEFMVQTLRLVPDTITIIYFIGMNERKWRSEAQTQDLRHEWKKKWLPTASLASAMFTFTAKNCVRQLWYMLGVIGKAIAVIDVGISRTCAEATYIRATKYSSELIVIA